VRSRSPWSRFGVLAPSASAVTTLNVIPHGQWEPGVPWAASPGLLPAETQAQMYDRLTPLFRDVTDAQLVPSLDGSGYYKSAALVTRTTRRSSPATPSRARRPASAP
jgi:hypothetical protein